MSKRKNEYDVGFKYCEQEDNCINKKNHCSTCTKNFKFENWHRAREVPDKVIF